VTGWAKLEAEHGPFFLVQNNFKGKIPQKFS